MLHKLHSVTENSTLDQFLIPSYVIVGNYLPTTIACVIYLKKMYSIENLISFIKLFLIGIKLINHGGVIVKHSQMAFYLGTSKY